MGQIIDLAAFQPEPLKLKMPSGTIYEIPTSVSVNYMTKLMNLQEKAKKIKDEMESINLLQNIAFEILKLDSSKEVTMDTVRSELDNLLILRKIPEIFNEHMEKALKENIPTTENGDTESPNA